jgi:PAS domain S-box-containing protein
MVKRLKGRNLLSKLAPTSYIPVLIVAKPDRMRESLRLLIELRRDTRVVGLADTWASALEMIDQCNPAIVILDTNVSLTDSWERILKQIKAASFPTRCLVLSDSSQALQAAQSSGADAVLVKGFATEKLFAAIETLRPALKKANDMENWLMPNKNVMQSNSEIARMRRRIAELETLETNYKKALLESEERFNRISELSEASFEGIAISDKGIIIEVNHRLASMLGYGPAEMIGKQAQDFVAPEARDFVMENMMADNEGPYEHLALKKDGTTFPVEVHAKLIPFDGQIVRVTAIRDISNRKQAEQEIFRRTRELLLLNRIISVSAASMDQNTILETVCHELALAFEVPQAAAFMLNEAGTEAIAVAEYVATGRPPLLNERVPVANNPLALYLLDHQEPIVIEDAQSDPCLTFVRTLLKRRGSGSLLIVPLIIEGEVVGCLGLDAIPPRAFSTEEVNLARNVATQVAGALGRIRLEAKHLQLIEQYRQAQKMEAIARLTTGIAHDFNNLLTSIYGFAELLQAALQSDQPRLQRMTGQIQASAQQAADMIRHLLAFSREQTIAPRILNLNKVVADTVKMLGGMLEENIILSTRLSPQLWPIKADPTQMGQVVVNLAVNARDAMLQGGRLLIETKNVILDDDYVTRHLGMQPGEHILLTVSDTGRGMSAETKARIFEPYFTTKEVGQGSGLGLATVLGIVEQSGGRIWVYSEPGNGTTFKIYLPRSLEETSDSTESEQNKHLPRGTEMILLVEDDPVVRGLTTRILREQGYTVLTASNGIEALQMAQARTDKEIHLLLTDTIMPQMGGRDLAERFNVLFPQAKIIFTSGYSEQPEVYNDVAHLEFAFIPKPFSVSELAHTVRTILDR